MSNVNNCRLPALVLANLTIHQEPEKDAKPAMVCTANDLLGWNDFPKGVRVLLLDEDNDSAAEMTSKLEEMDYIVSTFFSESEALSAISRKREIFHVAIVEVNTSNSNGRFNFLETTKDLPIIMTSNMHCLNTVMKCIVLGAVEFLHKPISEEKLKNIWQHVVHKAFNGGASVNTETLKPVKECVTSVMQLEQESRQIKNQASEEPGNETEVLNSDQDESMSTSDKFEAPLTPQINLGEKWLDSASGGAKCVENDVESKFVDTTSSSSVTETKVDKSQRSIDSVKSMIKEGDKSMNGPKGMAHMLSRAPNKKNSNNHIADYQSLNMESDGHCPSGTKLTNRKKPKIDWTPDLHKRFVQAVDQLGVDQAIPSRILELMKVEGLTRHNVASHLQKYRMHRRHILPKGEERWHHSRDALQRSYHPHSTVMAFPPYHFNQAIHVGQVYSIWGQLGSQSSPLPMWGAPPGYAWHPMETLGWQPYPGMHADAWGCPVMPPPQYQSPLFSQNIMGNPIAQQSTDGFHWGEQEIDKVVKEAISKPWLPLPIGLKSPSTDSVLTELSRQGISTILPKSPAVRPQHLTATMIVVDPSNDEEGN